MNPLYRNEKQGELPDSWYMASTTLPTLRPKYEGQQTADVCVIGAGYTGLSAAYHLARRGLSVIVLDAHRVGFGASGRNGGQVLSGFDTEQRELARKFGAQHAQALWDLTEEAKQDVRQICADDGPEAAYKPGVLYGLYSEAGLKSGAKDAAFLQEAYGYDKVSLLNGPETREILRSDAYQAGILDMGAGHIHPFRFVLGLAKRAKHAGARIFEHSEVIRLDRGDPAAVHTATGQVTANFVVLAGNGYLPHLDSTVASRVIPVNSFMCATEPLGDRAETILSRDIAVHDSRFVVNYFRLSEDRRLLMGGRPSYSVFFPKDIATVLRERIMALFPQLGDVKVDYAWGGTLGITVPRLPAFMRPAPNVLAAGGYSGQGVALSGLAGKVMAEAIHGQAARFDVLKDINVPPFPGGPHFAQPLLTLAMTWYGLRDRLGV